MWKEIKGFEGMYKVSDKGDVYSSFGRLLNLRQGKNGYYIVALYKKGQRKERLVHRLVAKAFVSNPEEKRTVNHKNGIKTDNRSENLEWATYRENIKHAFKNGLIKPSYGSNHHMTKLDETDVRRIKMAIECGIQRKELEKVFDVSKATIGYIARFHTWKHIKLKRA